MKVGLRARPSMPRRVPRESCTQIRQEDRYANRISALPVNTPLGGEFTWRLHQ